MASSDTPFWYVRDIYILTRFEEERYFIVSIFAIARD